MNKAVIPIQLVQAKNWYQHRIKNARSERFRAIMKSIYVSMISPLVDAFMPYPVPIDTLLKDYATEQGEIEVVGTPSMPKRPKKKKGMNDEEEESFWSQWADEDFEDDADVDVIDEEEMERQKLSDLAKLEAELREDASGSFEGPFGDRKDKSPFVSFRRDSDENDEE
jgi:predicted metal-dependent peptidase